MSTFLTLLTSLKAFIVTVAETTEEEKVKFKGATHKSDPKTLQTFDKNSFDDACAYIGLI